MDSDILRSLWHAEDQLDPRIVLAALGNSYEHDSVIDPQDIILNLNYLNPSLDTTNRESLAKERPWMMANLASPEPWFGPVFIPGKTACWECLAHRLRRARKAAYFLYEKTGTWTASGSPPAMPPETMNAVLGIVLARWSMAEKAETLAGKVVTFDTESLEIQSHQVVRRPQCPVCGDPKLVADRQSAPFVLQSRKNMAAPDGSSRSVSAEKTLQKIQHHVSPVCGIVHLLEPSSELGGPEGLTASYIAGHNFFHSVRDYGSDQEVLEGSFQDTSAGKGRQPLQSKVGAVCEAIERYSGVYQGDEACIWKTHGELGEAALHPNSCMLYSQQQYQTRTEWNGRGSRLPMTWVPELFDEDQTIEWSPVWSLTEGCVRYLPMAYCYYDYARKHKTWFARADSNGCAAGHGLEEAIVQGFLELVERDSVALWWYNCIGRPAVDLSSFDEPYFQEFLAYYHELRRSVWVLDISSDLGIPAFAALSRQTEQENEGILFGFGAHFDPQVAILRALTEVDQQLPVFSSVMADSETAVIGADPEMIAWWQTATVENHPYLVPDPSTAPKRRTDYINRSSDDFRTDVSTCVEIARAQGLETLVLDQTRPDMGLHVVKVIVPGLRHFWARFGPGRLYDMPVKMGWLETPRREDELNAQLIYV